MKELRRAGLVLLLGIAVGACGDAPEEAGPGTAEAEAEAVPAWVGEVAVVANAIEARPMAVDSILAAHEMTRATLDSLLYEIAEDPTLTAAYREARDR
ncbi:MAG: hypothetical protein R3314_08790 [Longimicrobiales bacterium]|nr:hypothetical protein [Longimicrobiales bacterium]